MEGGFKMPGIDFEDVDIAFSRNIGLEEDSDESIIKDVEKFNEISEEIKTS